MSQVSFAKIRESGPNQWGVRVKTDGRCPYSPGDVVTVTKRNGQSQQVTLGAVNARWNYGARTTVVVFETARDRRSSPVRTSAQQAAPAALDALRAEYRRVQEEMAGITGPDPHDRRGNLAAYLHDLCQSAANIKQMAGIAS